MEKQMPENTSSQLFQGMEDYPILDESVFQSLREIDGDELVIQLSSMFVEAAPALFKTWNEGFENRDLKVVAAIAHRFKGSAGNLGASHMAKVAERLETAARSGNSDFLNSESRMALINAFDRVVTLLIQKKILAPNVRP